MVKKIIFWVILGMAIYNLISIAIIEAKAETVEVEPGLYMEVPESTEAEEVPESTEAQSDERLDYLKDIHEDNQKIMISIWTLTGLTLGTKLISRMFGNG